jgi:hypothetical protein
VLFSFFFNLFVSIPNSERLKLHLLFLVFSFLLSAPDLTIIPIFALHGYSEALLEFSDAGQHPPPRESLPPGTTSFFSPALVLHRFF